MKTKILMGLGLLGSMLACTLALAYTGEQETKQQYKCIKSLEECIRAEDGSLVPYDYYE